MSRLRDSLHRVLRVLDLPAKRRDSDTRPPALPPEQPREEKLGRAGRAGDTGDRVSK
jgi:hypothetical protein